MNLQPDTSSPGLWINSTWQQGTPGAFAVIIGVSNYDHLQGGQGQLASKTYGLEQLYVSALTAYRFFCWLRDAYDYSTSPVAQCQLLLSPSKAELQYEPKLADNLCHPTFQNCTDAIEHWFSTMDRLPLNNAERSRAIFFFSGHGLEVTQEKQILLPADYLKPPIGILNKALSSSKIHKGMAGLKVSEQFFFLDACRNDLESLRDKEIEGYDTLNSVPSNLVNRKLNAPILYASASGTQAWQPTDPREGSSIFGQALIEGLQAQAGFKPDCNSLPCKIQFAPLHAFLKERVNQLIQSRNATVLQNIEQSGKVSDPFATLTHVSQPTATTTVLPSLSDIEIRSYSLGTEAVDFYPKRSRNNVEVERYAHEVFGSEAVTGILSGAKVYSLKTRRWLRGERSYFVHSVERSYRERTYRIVLSVPHSQGSHWLELNDGTMTFACVLPDDIGATPRYLLEINLGNSPTKKGLLPITRLEASLALENIGLLGRAAKLWQKYRTVNAAAAADAVAMKLAEEALRRKIESPLAATVAAIILLRTHRRDMLHGWLKNLANWFPEIPDGPVLCNEQILRDMDIGTKTKELIKHLLELRKRGLPHTAEGLSYAANQIEDFLEAEDLTAYQKARLRPLHQQLRETVRYFRVGGLFSVFAGKSRAITPKLIGVSSK